MITQVTGHIENGVVVTDEPLNLPDGANVEVHLVESDSSGNKGERCMNGKAWPKNPAERKEWIDREKAKAPAMTEEEATELENFLQKQRELQKRMVEVQMAEFGLGK